MGSEMCIRDRVYGAGADVLVAGSSVFGAEDPQAEVVKMLNA